VAQAFVTGNGKEKKLIENPEFRLRSSGTEQSTSPLRDAEGQLGVRVKRQEASETSML
jgi:hypothetical protein